MPEGRKYSFDCGCVIFLPDVIASIELAVQKHEQLIQTHNCTAEKLTNMTNQEINEAVARKLRGWFSNCKCAFPVETAHHNCPGEFGNCHHSDNCNLPNYCGSITAAWKVVENWNESGDFYLRRETIQKKMNWEADFCFNAISQASEWADTAPMAICRAFLKLPDGKT